MIETVSAGAFEKLFEYGMMSTAFVIMLLYVLKTTDRREERFYTALDKFNSSLNELADAFNSQSSEMKNMNCKVQKIEDEVIEIKHKM